MNIFSEPEATTVAILGSTGSIGRQALDVCRANPERFKVVALAAGSDSETLLAQAKEFEVPLVGLSFGELSVPDGVKAITGEDAAEEVVEATDAQVVLNAVVGAAGLKATLATIASGKSLALANKESLVAAGELVMAKAGPGQIRPVDSEHSALWQLLAGTTVDAVRRIFVTGSGGPFRGLSSEELGRVGVAEALAHPIWEMGRKITIDSATLMNKGLEVIEAHFLFGFTYDEIEVLIHPQGLVHGVVELMDGTVLMHAAEPDMRLPIQVALGWPERTPAPGGLRVDMQSRPALEFTQPDMETFRCLALAYEAGRSGDTFPAVLNAANEAAVAAFLAERLRFDRIAQVVERTLEEHSPAEPRLEGVLEADSWARVRAEELIGGLS